MSALSNQKSAFPITNSLRICDLCLKVHCWKLTAQTVSNNRKILRGLIQSICKATSSPADSHICRNSEYEYPSSPADSYICRNNEEEYSTSPADSHMSKQMHESAKLNFLIIQNTEPKANQKHQQCR
jgi:hypothetical protein